MSTILGFLSLVSFIALIVGLINPAIVLKWSKPPTRLKVIGYYICSLFILGFLISVGIDPDANTQSIINEAQINIDANKLTIAKSDLISISDKSKYYNEAQALIGKIDSIELEKKRQEEEHFKKIQDTFNKYLDKANINSNKYHFNTALKYIDSSLIIIPNSKEALELKGQTLYKAKKYTLTTEFYKQQMNILDKGNSYLMIAKAFRKLGKIEDAVLNAYNSKEESNEEGSELYEKLNPLKSIITGYRQRCCDGTTSYSTGKGTCSSHGGVCKWNEPIYSKRRKYKITSR